MLQRNEAVRQLEEELAEPRLCEEPAAAAAGRRADPQRLAVHHVHSLGGDSLGYHWLDDDHFALFCWMSAGMGLARLPRFP
jgi:hypothetical protein